MKISIHCLLFAAIIFTSATCKKDETTTPVVTTPKRSNKSILSVSVNPAAALPEIIKIDSANNTVYLRLSSSYDINSVRPIIKISEGATISPASGAGVNFNEPVTYTVKAEDGTTRTYTFIASMVKGQIVERLTQTNTNLSNTLNAYKTFCVNNDNNNNNGNGVFLTLGGCGSFDAGVTDLVFFRFKNKSVNDNLVGTYLFSSTSPTTVSVSARTQLGQNFYSAIIDGQLQITKYDATKRLISGVYSGNFYMSPSRPRNDETVYMTCEFINAQL